MKRIVRKYPLLIFAFIIAFGGFAYALGNSNPFGGETNTFSIFNLNDTLPDSINVNSDTVPPRFPVSKTTKTTYEDFTVSPPIDFTTPENVKTVVEYDPINNIYIFRTRVGDMEVATPFSMTADEYMQYTLKKSMSQYYKRRNSEKDKQDDEEDGVFSLKNIKMNVASTDNLFGPGGVKVKATGYVEGRVGIKHTVVANPMLSENARSRTAFDFDEDIQLNVQASVGDKINFDMNYDTEAMFDFDSKRIKLAYDATTAGDEDAILRRIEAGNVSMSTTNSLINGGTALFGIATELQFGKLRVNTVISQQEAESQTTSSRKGVQGVEFQFKADEYDENRHFFIAHYFRENYDVAMSKLPLVLSTINITNIEVWVTNSRKDFNQARNIVAFTDMAETKKISNTTLWRSLTTEKYPYNRANDLYAAMIGPYKAARDMSQVRDVLEGAGLQDGIDYEKLENARLLSPSEYYYNPKLGYISLVSALRADEVLAVAFSYTANGKTYQVGEFSTDVVSQYDPSNDRSGSLYLKLLKPTLLTPGYNIWDLMMKNVYNLGTTNIQKEDFKLEIAYKSDSLGTYLNYLPEGVHVKNRPLLQVMGLDRLNSQDQAHPDGKFDFIEGYTIQAQAGQIYFPSVEPFGKALRDSIRDNTLADKYVYQALYDETLVTAQQAKENDKYILRGSYRGSSSNSEINLNSTNIPQGSVTVTAGGTPLVENVDYVVDYSSGIVTILNQSLLDSNTPINVSSEGRSFSMQRKTLMGVNLNYDYSKNLSFGGTLMHYYEKPLTNKAIVGNESAKNTLWGLNLSYRTEGMWLTDVVNNIPFVNAQAPSRFNINAEFAQMMAGHYQKNEMGGYSYLDDFETSQAKIDLKNPYAWSMAAPPVAMFPPEDPTNLLSYGYKRSMLAWFFVDPIFTRKNSSLTPEHLKSDLAQLSNHFIREITLDELFPNRDIPYDQSSIVQVLNLSYYPQERGPYNLDIRNMAADGRFNDPENRWGGITRRLDVRDFESSNVEYIEFWLMDPFTYNGRQMPNGETPVKNDGGLLYINLGDISEDILHDGLKFFENGLPINDDPSAVTETPWGKVPKRQSTVYAFNDATEAERKKQDVGLNGLSTEEEFNFSSYKTYLSNLNTILSPTTIQAMLADPFSPLNDPAGDNYHFYRGSDYDREQKSILDRYKYYNNTEGNSPIITDSNESYSTAARTTPDVEDLDQDNTLNEKEAYFQYKIELKPDKMRVGENYIVDSRTLSVPLRNGEKDDITWYQFKVPIRDGAEKIGNIRNFQSVRFMRMFMTGFKQPTFLRFGVLQLVRGEWRTYERPLNDTQQMGSGTIYVSTVNIEENSERVPVNYVLPPGLDRNIDPDQVQLVRETEQSLSLKIEDLESGNARGVYKQTSYDMRRFKKLQLYTHLEEIIGQSDLVNGDLSVFIRLGSDYINNYYEYEIPMIVTPAGRYGQYNNADREIVWPTNNMFDFRLENLKNVKLSRNKAMRTDKSINYTTPFFEYDPDKKNNRITVKGNPSLSDVEVIMIGVRNNARQTKAGEVWVNELRLTDFDEAGGWAAQTNMRLDISDLASVDFAGRKETAGFGGIDQKMMERRLDDFSSYNIATSIDFGRFIPPKAKVSIPFTYGYAKEIITPKYDPFDQDVKMKESLLVVSSKAEKDSIRSMAQERVISKSINFSNVKVNIASSTPMPYDPANFSFSYGFIKSELNTPTLIRESDESYKLGMNYSYSPLTKTWTPFSKLKSKKGSAKFARSLSFNYLPTNIAVNSNISRFYSETLTRDVESYRLGGTNLHNNYLTWSQEFYWDRDFSLTWDFTRNLKFTFQSGTRAEIEEPYLQVNKKMNRSDYDIWRDAVWRSIKNFGTPLSYRQTATLTYQLPFRNIPVMDWVNSTAGYNSGYNWERGAATDTLEIGNTINNQMTLEFTNRLNMVNLYNKSKFLKRVNERFDSKKQKKQAAKRVQSQVEKKKKRTKHTIVLQKDTTVTLVHNLGTKDLDINAISNKKKYSLKYKKKDENTIIITNKDTVTVILDIGVKEPQEFPKWLVEVGEYTARGLMSVRTINVNYSKRNETYLAGFRPHIGRAFGQGNTGNYGSAPGIGFALGLEGGMDYVEKSLSRNWLVMSGMDINPAIYNQSDKLDLKAEIVPFKGLRIELNGAREDSRRTEIQYMYDGMPKTLGGSFSITTIALSSSFKIGKVENNYETSVFQKFLDNRQHVKNRLEGAYGANAPYPSGGFMNDFNGLVGTPYDPSIGDVRLNSSDVLIPAFLAAYTGKDVNKVSLSAFPSLSSILPNWNIRYDLLTSLPFLKEYLKSFEIQHAYQSFYQVGGYNSFSGWLAANGNLGYIRDELTERPIPSSPYDISSVSLSETFNPLFGVNGTLINNVSLNAQYNRSRVVNLNISSYQIVESLQNEIIVGTGYRINEFNKLIGLRTKASDNFNNVLLIKADLSTRLNQALIRKIEENFSQATNGTTTLTLMFSADYTLSRAMTIRAFFDRVMNNPFVSATAYATTNTNVGFSLRYTIQE